MRMRATCQVKRRVLRPGIPVTVLLPADSKWSIIVEMIRAGFIGVSVVLALFCWLSTAFAEGIDVSFPTGGYYRSGQVMPVVVQVQTYGNSADYNISLRLSPQRIISSDVTMEAFHLPPRASKSIVLPALIDARNPYLSLSIRDFFSFKQVLEQDLSSRIRFLNDSDRLFLVVGLTDGDKPLLDLLSRPAFVVKTLATTPDSGAFDQWGNLEGVDCVVVFPSDKVKWEEAYLAALRQYVEMGGRLILPEYSRNRGFVDRLFPALKDIAPRNAKEPFEVSILADDGTLVLDYGLGEIVFTEANQMQTGTVADRWRHIGDLIDFPAAPTSLFPPLPDTRTTSEAVSRSFRQLEMVPSYARTLHVTLAIIFCAFIFVAALIGALKFARKTLVSVVLLIFVSVGLTLYIHYYIPPPGIICQFRTIYETGVGGLGRATVFTSFSASTEMLCSLAEDPRARSKMLFSANDIFVVPSRTRNPEGGWVLRDIVAKRGTRTIVVTSLPLSGISTERSWLVPISLVRETAEVTAPNDTVFRRMYLTRENGDLIVGRSRISASATRSESAPEGFSSEEWLFLGTAASLNRRAPWGGNFYWPSLESGEMLSIDQILKIDIESAETLGAAIVFGPPASLPTTEGDRKK